MKIIGFITEYNPFHKGHKLHLETSKKISNATHSVAVMSGSFVQRGEPALVDKWSRAKMAIEGGVDLVLELPCLYSISSAELFASGGVKILNSLNCIDYLGFGSEIGEIKPLDDISNLLVNETEEFKVILKDGLKKGLSYANSRSIAVSSLLSHGEYDYSGIISKSNNILGIEYIKALRKLESKIEPVTFRRVGSDYNDLSVDVEIASASAIRNLIFNMDHLQCKPLLPKSSYDILDDFYSDYGVFNNLERYLDIISYLLLIHSRKDLSDYFDVEDGLENRIKNLNLEDYKIQDIIDEVTSKRIASSRIRRLLVHLLLGIKKDQILESKNHTPGYIRVLGSNEKGFEIINRIKESSELNIITKFSDVNSIGNKTDRMLLDKEILSTNLYFYGLSGKLENRDYDYINTPYIKK